MSATRDLSKLITGLQDGPSTEAIGRFIVEAEEGLDIIDDEINDLKHEISELRTEVRDREADLLSEQQKVSSLKDENTKLAEGLHANNMMEEDKLEVCKRLFKNLTLNQLLELEKSGKLLNKNYNEYAS
jgi:septal ring factor EnvC (AmiA/AmiB activator)